jgi:hypothetical protein
MVGVTGSIPVVPTILARQQHSGLRHQRDREPSPTALCLCFCTLHTNEILRTDPLVQVNHARVVDLDIGASKSDICAIAGKC